MQTEQQLTIIPQEGTFSTPANFEHAQRVAKMLCQSDLVPQNFKGNVANTVIAIEMSNRLGANPLMVMQNLYIVYGKPAWSSSFIIAAINSSKRFTGLQFQVSGEGVERGCIAYSFDQKTGERIEGPKVTIKMATDEGWTKKNGSKWATMPELMLRYRAATFFGRLYCPEILMGMHTEEEIQDVVAEPSKPVNKEEERFKLLIEDANTTDELMKFKDNLPESLVPVYEEKLAKLMDNELN